jgi:hypothetical protein
MSGDDRDSDQIPEPDAPANAAEKARADGFGRLVDRLLAGDALPPAMDSDDRALVETATMVLASTRDVELAAERRRALIDRAMERAVLGQQPAAAAAAATTGPKKPGVVPGSDADIAAVTGRAGSSRGRFARALPWTITSIAAAAAIALFLTRPEAPVARTESMEPRLETFHRSRPADPLIGQIRPEQAAHASARLDSIYSDRMAGYRDLMFRRRLDGGKL